MGDTTPAMFIESLNAFARPTRTHWRIRSHTDHDSLTRPWTFTKHYERLRDPKAWVSEPETCGGPEDRNPIVNGHITVTLPTK